MNLILHHVQISCPPGGEQRALRFYRDGLGLVEVPKPANLAKRGGVWFRSLVGSTVGAEVHVGVEQDFTPARKAHPAFLVSDEFALSELGERLDQLGFPVDWTERESFPGYLRFHTQDGSGNRVEILSPLR